MLVKITQPKVRQNKDPETLKSLGEQFTSDWKAWQDYFTETREQVQHVFEAATPESPKARQAGQKIAGTAAGESAA